MNLTYRFNRYARREFDATADQYSLIQAELGLRFVAVVEAAVSQICKFPESCPPVRGDIRKKVLSSFPYLIFYRIWNGRIRILAVAHARREPLYWLGRV